MKHAKKLLSLLLCATLIFAMFIPAFAKTATDAALPFENSEFFETGDYTIHYRVIKADEEKGQIFMIHGFALSGACWEQLADIMSKNGYTCVLADLPDFGYSSRETEETEFLPREDIMHSLMTYLSDEPWYVAGHSMGGYIAMAIAEKYPESVKNLLLYGTSGNSGNTAMNKVMTNQSLISIMGTLMELMAKSAFLVRLLAIMGLADIKYGFSYDISKIQAPLLIEGTGKGAIYSFSMLPATNYTAVEGFAPILFLNGSKDYVITDSLRTELREHLPEGSCDRVIEGGGHMFIENMAEASAEITLEFLANNT